MFGGQKKNILDAKLKDSIKKTLDKNKDCYYEANSQHSSTAIQSHSVWKSGILKILSKDNVVYWIDPNERYKIFNDKKELFSPVIIKNATVYRGFCNTHDTKIFKEIEVGEKYIESPIQNFLYCYRAFSYQHVQEILSTEAYELFEDESRKLHQISRLNNKEMLHIQGMVKSIKERTQKIAAIFSKTSKEFHNIFKLIEDEQEYTQELDEKFIIKSFKIKSRIECACSGIGDPILDSEGNRIHRYNNGFLFYNLFPQDDNSSYFIVGLLKSDEKVYDDIINYLEQEYKSFELGIENKFLLAVQNLVVNGSENIVLSPELHLKMKEDGTISKLVEQFEGSVAKDIVTQKFYQDLKKNYGYSLLS